MSWLSLFRGPEPWDGWQRSTSLPLTYDVQRRSLSGVAFGDPLVALEPFGRPGNARPRKHRTFVYPTLGLEVHINDADAVSFFTCVFSISHHVDSASDSPDFTPCALYVVDRTTRLSLSGKSTRNSIGVALGELAADESGGLPIYGLTFGSTWFGFTFDDNDHLTMLDVEPCD